jgi:serine/threonine-protein kinase
MSGLVPGAVLNDRYELRERIGGGSMGEVWRGRDLTLGRTVAVKIVLPSLLEAPTFLERFAAEARVMAMIDHPGVVGVFDFGYTPGASGPGTAFLVMEFIEGESLDRVLTRLGPLEPGFVLEALVSLLDALAAVHRQGVVHRDVKPGNVMLRSEGVVLADFGIARSPESLGLTAADKLMGTVPYLAPELFRSEGATPAADVYAVGVLAYELLDGRPPFHSDSTAAVMFKHVNEPPPPLPDYVPDDFVALLERALAKRPEDRWPDAAAMAVAVRAVLAGDSVPEWERTSVEPVMRLSGSGEQQLEGAWVDGDEGARIGEPGPGRRRSGAGTGSGAASRPDTGSGEFEAGEADEMWNEAAEGPEAARRGVGGRHGSGESERGLERADGAGAASRRTGGRNGSGEQDFDGTAVMDGMRRTGGGNGSGTGDHSRGNGGGNGSGNGNGGGAGSGGNHRNGSSYGSAVPPARDGRRRALIPVLCGVAAIVVAVTMVAVSQGSGSSGKAGDSGAAPQVGMSNEVTQSTSDDVPSPSFDASPTRTHLSGTGHTSSKPGSSPSSASPKPSGTNTATSSVPVSPSGGSASVTTPVSQGSTTPTTVPSSTSTSNATAKVPDVSSQGTMTPAAAHNALSAVGFGYKDNQVSSTGPNCVVTAQSLPPNSTQPYGSVVTLTIACS